MTASIATAEYRVRVATRGATTVSGNVDYTLSQTGLADIPTLSGPSVDLLKGTTTSHPFRIECLVDDALTVASGRMTAIGRLAEIQRSVDGGAYSTIGTGRISHVSEMDGRGKVTVEVSDERWVERRTEIFRTTDTVQLHPPGFASAWLDRTAAGTRTYTVAEVNGDAVRIKPNDEDDFQAVLHVPLALRQALAGDMIGKQTVTASNSSGNFTALRFEYDSADRTVISFRENISATPDTPYPTGILGTLSPFASGLLTDAWVYISGHSLSATDEITGRFYWPTGVAVSETVPLHIGGAAGIHPFELLEDILDGDYGGQAVRYDATAMQALQDKPFKNVWARITEPSDRSAWLEQNIYQPFGCLPLVGTDLNIHPTSLRLPLNINPASLAVLTAADSGEPTWEHSSRDVVTVVELVARYARALSATGVRPDDWPVDEYETGELKIPRFTHDNTATLGEVVHRVNTDLILSTSGLWAGQPFDTANELAVELFDVFGDGASYGEIEVPDNGGHEVGDFVLIDHDTFQGFNPESGARTGDRLALLTGFRDYGPASVTFQYLDMGPNSAALSAPTVAIAQDGTDADLVNVTISGLGSGESATVEVATGSSPPTFYDQTKAGVGNETVTFRVNAGSGTAYARAYATKPGRIRSAYGTDTVALSTRPRITSADVVMASYTGTVTWTVPANTLGMRTRYSIHDRGADASYGSQTDYATSAGGFTITGIGPRQVVAVELTPYTGWTGSAVSGTAGDITYLLAIFPRITGGLPTRRQAFVVQGVEVTFDANGEAVVSATGDEDVANMYVTVGNGSAPSDPTVGTNDGTISGRTGTVSTGVKITTGNDAYVKVIAADASGNVSPVSSARSARRLGQFHKDTSSRGTSGTSETTLETITIPADALGEDGGIRMVAAVGVNGINSTKTLRLKLEGTLITTFTYASGFAQMTFLTVYLFNDGATNDQRVSGMLVRTGSTPTAFSVDMAEDSTADMDLTITGQCANSGDDITLATTVAEYVGTD